MKGILSAMCFIAGLILVISESPNMGIQLILGCSGIGMLALGAFLAGAFKEEEDVLYR